jgi:hypothetical protein
MRLPTVTLENRAGKRVIVDATRPERIEFWRRKGFSVVGEARGDDAPAADPLAPILAAEEAAPEAESPIILSPRRGRRGGSHAG